MDTDTLTIDSEEQAMRDLGHETDVAQGREPEAPPTPEPRPPAEPEQPQAEQEAQQPEAEQQQQPEVPETPEEKLGRDIKTGQFKKAEKPETEYSKAQKEEIRKTRTWQNIQAEKEQHRQEVAQWQEQRRMEQLEAVRQQYQPLKKEGLTAKEYIAGAKRFVQEGDYENAYKAHVVATELNQAEYERANQMREVEAEYNWRRQMQELGTQYPQIYEEPIAGHLQRIIGQNPDFYRIPNGFRLAAEGAHLLVENQQLKEANDEIIRLKAELEKSQRKGQPARGGHASPRTTDKDFADMDLNEQEAELRRMTQEADAYR